MDSVHSTAQVGFTEGTNELYDRARPSYPSESLEALREYFPGSKPLNIVELASGTGLFTRALLAHPMWKSVIGKLVAVEPSQGMRNVFTRAIHDERVITYEGTFTSTKVEDAWADLTVIAQAWHWAHPDYDTAIAEISRITKPGGVVAFIWNMEDRESSAWVDQIRYEYEQFEGGAPQFRSGWWKATFETPSYLKSFESPNYHYNKRTIPTTTIGVLERCLSKSYIVMLSKTEKERLKDKMTRILDVSEKVWIDKDNGVFEYPYTTTLLMARRQ